MPTALYYPHTTIQKPDLLKTALLLWDKVEYIVPKEKFIIIHHQNIEKQEKKLIERGLEVIGKPHVPSQDEKDRVHSIVDGLVKSNLPDWLLYNSQNPESNYDIYPDKFDRATWELLMTAGFAKQSGSRSGANSEPDWSMHKSLGLILMAILAEVCGEQKDLITDQTEVYEKWVRFLTKEGDGEYSSIQQVSELKRDVSDQIECLVKVSLQAINVQDLNLESLIELREREKNKEDTVLPLLRKKYYEELNKYTVRLKSCTSKTGVKEVEEDFRTALEDDLNLLRDELRIEDRRTLWSSGMVTALTVGAGTLISLALPVFGVPMAAGVGVFGVASVMSAVRDYAGVKKAELEYIKDRNKVLKEHPASFLYKVANG